MRGFSLVEALIVLAILGTLLAVGSVGLLGYLQTTRLNQARQEVATALRLVGNKALTESRPYTVSVQTGTPAQIRWAPTGSSSISGNIIVPYDVRIASVTPSGPIQYVGRGFPVQQYTLTLQLGPRSTTVVLLPTGKVVTP